jgi:hypothetical protein
LAAALCALAALAACGKKGPPLAPLIPIPAAIETISADRVGNDAFVTVTLPAENLDQFKPADLASVQIFGYTGRTAPPRTQWTEIGTLIATVPVAPPPPRPGEPEKEITSKQAIEKAPADAPLQGQLITVRDTLTPDELVQGKLPKVDPTKKPVVEEPTTAKPAKRPVELPLKRFYTAFPFSARGRNGPPGAVAELPLVPVPDAPPSLSAEYGEHQVLLSWEPSGGLLGFLLERVLPDEPPPIRLEEEEEEAPEAVAAPVASGPVLYNVYRDDASADWFAPPSAVSAAAWHAAPATPVNPVPIPLLSFADGGEFNRGRCYTVRAVRGIGPGAMVGAASPPVCVMPIDTFPPMPPRGLATVSSEGAINLIWEPNTELDLGGYIVLRGEGADDTLQPLTKAPVREASFRDDTVKSGVRYVYAVVAVDNRFPMPNISIESDRVEETAR